MSTAMQPAAAAIIMGMLPAPSESAVSVEVLFSFVWLVVFAADSGGTVTGGNVISPLPMYMEICSKQASGLSGGCILQVS